MKVYDMRRILISKIMSVFLVLALAPSLASAQWNRSGDWSWRVLTNGSAVITYSEKYGSRTQLLVIFGASAKCSPTLYYSQTESINDRKNPVGPFQGGFQARIDTRAPWRVNPGEANAFYSKPSAQGTHDYTIALNVKENLILELAYGQTFRILRTDTGDTDRFSLTGSAVAISNAFNACEQLKGKSSNPDLQYFNQSPPAQQRQAPPPSQDSDRQFFR
jgi:hypothetical protein